MSSAVEILSFVFGWIYTITWSLSFYPQIYLNFKRGSTKGLSSDYVLNNMLGFTCYALYNIVFYFDKGVRKEYFDIYGKWPLVELNDVILVCHLFVLSLIIVWQGSRNGAYKHWLPKLKRGQNGYNIVADEDVNVDAGASSMRCDSFDTLHQKDDNNVDKLFDQTEKASSNEDVYALTWPSLVFFCSSVFGLVLATILASSKAISWLDWLYYLFIVKVSATLCKCVPQIYMNYKLKSTIGYSIFNVLLDFSGGLCSLVQMVLDAYITQHWEGIYGNPLKSGLGIVSILLDIIYMLQHYVWYRGNDPFVLQESSKETSRDKDFDA
ncbi:hypothetical protein MP638_001976 [Amoeboaphelidium occidentale]|nr:hypothetical protein MP638_001976 [Amoeboaphelidium occidentale]